MRLPPTRASACILSLVEGFVDGPRPRAAAAALLTVFDEAGWMTDGYRIEDVAEGQLIILPFGTPPPIATLQVAGLPLTARISLSSNGGQASLRVLQDAAGRWIEVGELTAAIDIDTALLQPVDDSSSHVEIDAALKVRVDRQWNVDLIPKASLSLPWSRVGNLPIELKLDNLLFDVSTDTTPAEILSLGYDGSFVGIYAETAILRLLPELRFGTERGLVLKASSFALSQRGLTARLSYFWRLDHDGRSIAPTSELTASLLDQLAIGLDRIEVSIRDNLPEHFLARGVVALPLLPTLLSIDFGLQVRPGGCRLQVQLASLEPIRCGLGIGQLDIGRLTINGDLEPDHFVCQGQMDQIALVLGPINISMASAQVRLEHSTSIDEVILHLGEVELGPLGSVPGVELVMRETRSDAATEHEFYLSAQIVWQDIKSRIQLPANLPAPPDNASVTVKVFAHDGSAGVETTLSLSVGISDFQNFGDWLPAALRPEARNASLSLSVTYAEGDFAGADTAGQLQVTASGAIELRLPDLSLGTSLDLLNVDTGDPQGWVKAQFSAGIDPQGEPYFDVAISDALSITVQLPGLTQAEPPIRAQIKKLEMQIRDADVVEGALTLTGHLDLAPIVPPRSIPIAQHVEEMFAAVGLSQVSGDCVLTLRFRDEHLKAELDATFEDAGIEVDLFRVLSNLSAGLGVTGDSGVQLSLDAGVHLSKLNLSLGSLEENANDSQFAVNLIATVSIGGLIADLVFAFSDHELELGIKGHETEPGRWNTDIPLSLPKLPVKVSDLDLLAALGWNLNSFRGRRSGEIAAALGVANLDGDEPRVARARDELAGTTFLLGQIADLRKSLGPSARDTYINLWIRNFIGAFEGLTGWMSLDSDARLRLENLSLKLPLADPRNLGIEGTLRIVGFADDDPFAGLNDTTLSAGISADLIYFALEGTGDPITLPGIGRYTKGKLSIGEFRVGYGYTSNSFNLVIAGTLEPPPALIADIDTSEELGFGVRFPDRNEVYFRLGLIPIPGPIPAVPVFDFNLDLRSPGSQPLVDADQAVPYWDGLQFIINDLFRVDLKHLAMSPMLGPLAIPNVRYDGDWLIGNDDLGLTVIADNVHVLYGIGVPPTPIPFFADAGAPYFDNLVVNLRLAGFKLNVNIQHPFPSFDPLALLELFAMLSDPSVPLDPNGALANVLRLTVKNVHVALPQWARQLFPEAGALVEKPGEFTLNMGTGINAVGALLAAGSQTLEMVTETGSSLGRAITRLPKLALPDIDAILAALPPELRKIRLGGELAGFEARVVILLISPKEAAYALDQRDSPAPVSQAARYSWGNSTKPGSASSVPFPLGSRTQRESQPFDPSENLFLGLEFSEFSAADLEDLPGSDAAAIVIAARVKVFEAQRYRFLGIASSDGFFRLVTTVDVRPLELRVAGITVRIPFECSGRMMLEGRTRRDGAYGQIEVQGYARWEPIPGVSLSIGSQKQLAFLALRSNGVFRAQGSVRVRVFAAGINGYVDLSNTHCFVSGDLSYYVGRLQTGRGVQDVVALELEVDGRIGPGTAFRLTGDGSLRILGQSLTDVSAVVTNKYAEVSASIDTDALPGIVGVFPLELSGSVSGSINLARQTNPSFALKGQLTAKLFDFDISGAGHISSNGSGVRVGVEGSLLWGNHAWLGGFLEVGTNGFLSVGGRTRFAFPLTPPEFNGLLLANLYCEVNVGGRFTINPDKGLASWRADASCLFGVRLPSPSNQFIPLASYNASNHGNTQLRMEILRVSGFKIPGLPNIDLVIPDMEDAGELDIDWVEMGFRIPNVLTFGFTFPYFGNLGNPRNWPGFLDRDDLMTIPLSRVKGLKTVTLGEILESSTVIYLTFVDGKLQLEIESGGQTVNVPLVG